MTKKIFSILLKRDIYIPAVFLLLASLPFFFIDIDIRLSSLFYDPSSSNHWPLNSQIPWSYLYNYGTWPALLLALLALLSFIISFVYKKLIPYRKQALYLSAVMIIGPGLIVNTLFKDNFGRPRPRDIIEFGGQQQYHQLFQSDWGNEGRSFPCGHCSGAFYFFVLYFCAKGRKKKWLPYAGLTIGLGYGTLMGISRIVQGGHFLSDVLWSAGIVYLTAGLLFYLIKPFDVQRIKPNRANN